MKRVFVLSPLAPIFGPPAACRKPPAGWTCSRELNHKGPCAASESAPLFSFESNVSFARQCCMNSIGRGEAPFVPHLHYPFVGLDDFEPRERALGIRCGLSWLAASEIVAVYVDRGVTKGMRQELAKAKELWQEVEYVGGPNRIEELLYEGDFSRCAEAIMSLRRRTDFRRLDGGPAPSWQWLHAEGIPHLRDMNGDACPECFGAAL